MAVAAMALGRLERAEAVLVVEGMAVVEAMAVVASVVGMSRRSHLYTTQGRPQPSEQSASLQ